MVCALVELINSLLEAILAGEPASLALDSLPERSGTQILLIGLRCASMPIQLRVNSASATVDVPPEMPLLWVLRDILDLKGTKFGCGIGLCGACTVHLGGRAVRSCLTQVGSVGNQPITTIEGLSSDGLHPMQVAWEAVDVPQCGYCQAGQIMSAVALLKENPHPTDEDINSTMSGNLCRCGTYARIRQAIHAAAAQPGATAATK